MSSHESIYSPEPTVFHSMRQAQELTHALEDNVVRVSLGAANTAAELAGVFSELVNAAAEHGMSEDGAHAHVRFMPHRSGSVYDAVVVDSGAGIRATLTRNPNLPRVQTDAQAIQLAVQEKVSGTGHPTRGLGLWMTVTEMRKPGRKFWLHSGSALLVMYGDQEPGFREIEHRQGVMARLTAPC